MRGTGSDKMGKSAVRRLARDLHPVTIKQWLRVNEADKSSKYMGAHLGLSREAVCVARIARELSIEEDKPARILTGDNLMAMGMSPGPDMGVVLDAAEEAQLDGAFVNDAEAMEWAWNNFESLIVGDK
jgi:tRNA nucleotidyltransferase (CCA-adding enzyme)